MTPKTAELVVLHGGDPVGHRARAISRQMIDAADLVLTMTREHRATIVGMAPDALHRTFTLRESARLLAVVGVTAVTEPTQPPDRRLPALVAVLSRARGIRQPSFGANDDVVDPFCGDDALYALSAAQILPGVRAWINALAPEPAPPRPWEEGP